MNHFDVVTAPDARVIGAQEAAARLNGGGIVHGSGEPRKYSELDSAIELHPLSLRSLRKLKDALEDSDLPICIDIVDWHQADD